MLLSPPPPPPPLSPGPQLWEHVRLEQLAKQNKVKSVTGQVQTSKLNLLTPKRHLQKLKVFALLALI